MTDRVIRETVVLPMVQICADCDSEYFMHQTEWLEHMLEEHQVVPTYDCSECVYSSTDINDISAHLFQCHRFKTMFTCPECKYAHAIMNRVTSHYFKFHTEEGKHMMKQQEKILIQIYKCPECEEEFK